MKKKFKVFGIAKKDIHEDVYREIEGYVYFLTKSAADFRAAEHQASHYTEYELEVDYDGEIYEADMRGFHSENFAMSIISGDAEDDEDYDGDVKYLWRDLRFYHDVPYGFAILRNIAHTLLECNAGDERAVGDVIVISPDMISLKEIARHPTTVKGLESTAEIFIWFAKRARHYYKGYDS